MPESGPAIGLGNVINGNLHDIVLPIAERKVERWFNTSAGFERDNQKQLGSNIRTFPLRLTGLRSEGHNDWDISVLKDVRHREADVPVPRRSAGRAQSRAVRDPQH